MVSLSAAPTLAPDDVMCEASPILEAQASEAVDNVMVQNVVFMEFFAGEAGLTHAVRQAGVNAEVPQDLAADGVDFSKEIELECVKNHLHELHASGYRLHLHFAPPCSTFSRARDRSWRTRLRSTERPQGLAGRGGQCRVANLVARNTLDLLEWSVRELGAVASLENPEASYLWLYLDFSADLVFQDATFSPCMFGADVRKPTKVRCWGWFPEALVRKEQGLAPHGVGVWIAFDGDGGSLCTRCL